jgi:hypothetical protein
MMFYIFNDKGHYAEKMTCRPPILPVGYFFVEAADDLGDYLFSDGLTVMSASEPAPSQYHVIDAGMWVLSADGAAAQLAAAKAEKISNLNASAQAFINSAAEIDKVPDFEVQTWTIQAAEAKAYAADNTADTPVLDQIAASRGIDAAKLKAAALRKTLAYEKLTAHIAGQRQALQSKIEAAKTQAALEKIVIEFTAPEAV